MKPLVILTGPTAVGKTKLSIELAKMIHAEIISADSMQVYRHMDIGTAKIRTEEMEGVVHHLVDVIDPAEEFNVVRFQQMAYECMEHIYAKGKIPLIVGGTGFYIQALIKAVDFTKNDGDMTYRKELEEIAKKEGGQILHDRLRSVDEQAALDIHPNNIKKVIRALEFYHQTNTKISEHNEEQKEKESPFQYAYFVLNDDRQKLYDRIDARIDEMLNQGLIDEVRHLRELGYTKDLVSMQGLGYKEIFDYLDGITTLEEAVTILKRDTRHFAKRQLTWFRREKDVIWVNKEEFSYDNKAILDFMKEKLELCFGKDKENEGTI